jgi:photosystem II stability/assembly factor-like uncharacterized protein
MTVIVATQTDIVIVDADRGTAETVAAGVVERPTCLAADPLVAGRVWCGTHTTGVFRSDDAGRSWSRAGLAEHRLMSVAASAAEPDSVWAGTDPSQLWHSRDAGQNWRKAEGLEDLPSRNEWAFPPRPHTHHVRWIACHPTEPGRLWAAIEAGALISTPDNGRTWFDRVPGGPWDTHELAIHPQAPDTLRVSAGDGYFESHDAGATWASPAQGLDVGYLRSVAIDPGDPHVVIVSAASGPRSTYVAGSADGRLFRRAGRGPWQRVTNGWPDRPSTIAPLLTAGTRAGELWAADERGVHRSDDAGVSWQLVASYASPVQHLRGLAVTG